MGALQCLLFFQEMIAPNELFGAPSEPQPVVLYGFNCSGKAVPHCTMPIYFDDPQALADLIESLPQGPGPYGSGEGPV